MANRLRVAAVGEVSLDIYVETGDSALGGCSCNLARAAADAGAHAALFAVVGDDDRGKDVLARLAATSLERHVRVETGATAVQQIRVEPSGERTFCGWAPGVVAAYAPSPDELAALRGFDVLALADTPAWDACLALPGPRKVADFSQDAATAWRFAGLDIAFVGGTPGDLDRLRAHARDQIVVLTAGAAGAWALAGDRVLHQPSLATTVVDTTGCGDAFQGAFTVAHFSGSHLAGALAAGARAAAACAGRRGA
jgi:sugar/nucleoside kinase (ribokinase family)